MENIKYFFYYDADLPPGLGVKNFSLTHFSWLTVTFVTLAVVVYLFRGLTEDKQTKVIKGFALLLVMNELARILWAVAIGHFDVSRMLPLHLCGIMVFVEAFAVFTKRKLFKEFAYCSGLPGAFFALLTPEPSGYPLLSFQYLQSIIGHGLLVLIPLLWVFGQGFRPDAKYLFKSFLLLVSLTVFDAVVNSLLKSNYLFISYAPKDTPIELFDNWVGHPWYVGLLLVSVVIVWLAMYLPWEINSRLRAAKVGDKKIAG